MGCFKLCACVCCFFIAIVALIVFLIAAAASVNPKNVHHYLEDATISGLNISELPNPMNQSQLSGSITFRVRSHNPNKYMGVRFWHFRIAIVYDGMELGRAYAAQFVQWPRNITHLEAGVNMTDVLPPQQRAPQLRADISTGYLPLRIYVKVRAKFKRVDKSWKTKLVSYQLAGDDKCRLNVSLSNAGTATHFREDCSWKVQVVNNDA